MTAHEGGFLSGKDAPGAVDYLLWPWFERLGAVKKLKPGGYSATVWSTSSPLSTVQCILNRSLCACEGFGAGF